MKLISKKFNRPIIAAFTFHTFFSHFYPFLKADSCRWTNDTVSLVEATNLVPVFRWEGGFDSILQFLERISKRKQRCRQHCRLRIINTESETSRFVFIDLPLAILLHLLQGLLKLPHIVHSVIICLHNPRHLSWQCHNFKTITDLDNTFVIRDNFGNSTALMEQDENKSVCIWPIWQWFHFLRSTWWQKWRDQWKALMDL